jgi:hypothetical protein
VYWAVKSSIFAAANLQIGEHVQTRIKIKKMELYEHFTDISATPFYMVFNHSKVLLPDKIFANDDWEVICIQDKRLNYDDDESFMNPFYRIFRIKANYLYLVCGSYPDDYLYLPIKFKWFLGLFTLICVVDHKVSEAIVMNWMCDFIYGGDGDWGFYYCRDLQTIVFGFSKTLKEKVIEAFKGNPYLMNKEKVLAFLTPCYVTDKEAHDATLIANNPWVNRLDEYYELLTK